MKMPLTAIALGVEFTRVGHDFLVPLSLAVAGSFSACYLCGLKKNQELTKAEDGVEAPA
jgi:hypothetical protein